MTAAAFLPSSLAQWDEIDRGKFRDEHEVVAELLAKVPLTPAERESVVAEAVELVERARKTKIARAWSRASCRSFRSAPARAWP